MLSCNILIQGSGFLNNPSQNYADYADYNDDYDDHDDDNDKKASGKRRLAIS